jgi:pimeloyl-ACP methyl ester carboxylesterase
VEVTEIPDAAHFLFYDNPIATFQAIGEFIRN